MKYLRLQELIKTVQLKYDANILIYTNNSKLQFYNKTVNERLVEKSWDGCFCKAWQWDFWLEDSVMIIMHQKFVTEWNSSNLNSRRI